MNRPQTSVSPYAWLLIFLLSVSLLSLSCGEKEVPFIVDQDEMARYLAETEAGRELFRVSNLITGDSYTLDFDTGAVYEDILDSTRRVLDFDMILPEHFDTLKQDFGSPFGWARDAEVTVQDRLFVTTRRVKGTTTIFIKRERTVSRYAYFIKLGSDTHPYAGWVLYAYNGNTPFTPAGMTIERADHSVFPGDGTDFETFSSLLINTAYQPWDTIGTLITSRAYLKLEDVSTIEEGEMLVAVGDGVPSRSVYQSLSAETDSGFCFALMKREGNSTYIDTINTPDPNNRLWNILFFEEFRRPQTDTSGAPDLTELSARSWAVPYRVQQ